jgi:hypothetical protein
MNDASDASYYAQLRAGAIYLAETTDDADERAEHLKMAEFYRRRALDAMPRR